ncbi:MAG: leucine-rich repeat protein [Malacoplasma sp.]|nr:leucine-rich repeat protein [Malacoplasma sp.]
MNHITLYSAIKYSKSNPASLFAVMRFFEKEQDIFVKQYKDVCISINTQTQEVFFDNQLAFLLDGGKGYIKLECINRILSLGYELEDISVGSKINKFCFKGFNVIFVAWKEDLSKLKLNKNEVIYKSRLISGVFEYKTKINNGIDIYDYGIFESKTDNLIFTKAKKIKYDDPNFIIEENKVIKYIGKDKVVKIPEGIEALGSSSFWDNQYIEEVIVPNTLKNMGGDTFYYCKNLKKINIPKSVVTIGNNPFAGCLQIKIENQSPHFIMENGVLYSADKQALIYCSIKGEETKFNVPEGVKIICKHAFYCCDRFEYISLPTTLLKMENNPFSGCTKLELECKSKTYVIQDDVIYNCFKTAVIGVLNKIKTQRLELIEGLKSINRNSFWNCKGIQTIVLPESLEDIGYNPFVGCTNIQFENKSPHFKVVDGVLYNQDLTKIICYPTNKAVGVINLLDSVITLERGAFSGCDKMTQLNLHNVNVISKSCFTNCTNLKKLYCSDLITYIGEWAFAYCKSLKEVSVNKEIIIDNNAFSNCNAELIVRNKNTNYLIESENLYTLQAMQKRYLAKIDSILIDPPYNSHIDYIGYKDGNYEDGYAAFMKQRIELSYNLLSDKGFLVINIDGGEVNNLAILCCQYFKHEFVKIHKWKKKHPFFDANRVELNPNKIQTDYEYIIICRKSANAQLKKIKQPYFEDGVLKEKETDVPETFDCFGTTSSAKDEIQQLFGTRDYFSTPKPLKLMKELIQATTDKNSIILDYFAGSGTVGHACLDLNQEDSGQRTFILVCNNESDICEKVTYQRLKKATNQYKKTFEFIK